VQVDPLALNRYGVILDQIRQALANASANTGGGLVRRGEEALVVCGIGIFERRDDIGRTVVSANNGRTVLPVPSRPRRPSRRPWSRWAARFCSPKRSSSSPSSPSTPSSVESKIFAPVAFTLSFAMLGALLLTMTLMPVRCLPGPSARGRCASCRTRGCRGCRPPTAASCSALVRIGVSCSAHRQVCWR
jgi:hypothetical protein